MKKCKFFLALGAALAAGLVFADSKNNLKDTVGAQGSLSRSANSGFAEEEFRRGVQSYYRGSYNESIIEFEKALSYLPGENLIMDWLGKAYYKAGIEGAAILQWQFASENDYGGILLKNRIEIVGDRRITQDEYEFTQRYTSAGNFSNVNGNNLLYSQPINSLANPDGTVWVVAYGTNELVLYNVNGIIKNRVRGPLNGFDRPMDIIRLSDGNLLVSESAGDRLALLDGNGRFIKYFGSKGRGEGQLVGPQYLAQDSFGNIYVTDFGNNRVVVFDPDGNGLLHFGGKSLDFNGFKSPTGIAVIDDRVFVADSVTGAIYEFDRSGNFMGNLVMEKTFARPESMKQWGAYLVITDRNKIFTIDTASGATYESARTPRGTSSITSVVPDANGNLIVTDFKDNTIYVMSKVNDLVGGYFVQIERVVADNFPNVIVEVRVENRSRQPIVGLDETNFLITEGKHSVSNFEFMGSVHNNDFADITILVDRSEEMRRYEDEVTSAVRELAGAMEGRGIVKIISAGAVPVIEYTGSPLNLSDFSVKALKTPYSDLAALDMGARLATNDLVNAEKKRGIIYITAGQVNEQSFTKYSLSDVATYMNNNSVSFTTVTVNQGAMSNEVKYITENTTGGSYYIYRPEGLVPVIRDIISIPSGLYQMSYTSNLSSEYGIKYLPVEVETYLLNYSGTDETGYFAPLE